MQVTWKILDVNIYKIIMAQMLKLKRSETAIMKEWKNGRTYKRKSWFIISQHVESISMKSWTSRIFKYNLITFKYEVTWERVKVVEVVVSRAEDLGQKDDITHLKLGLQFDAISFFFFFHVLLICCTMLSTILIAKNSINNTLSRSWYITCAP